MLKPQTNGYSIVEVLVAVTILLVAVSGPLTIAYKGIKTSAYAREQTTAFFLAQEGIESIVKLRNEGVLSFMAEETADPWDWVDAIPSECTTEACGINTTGVSAQPDWSLFICSNPPTSFSCDLSLAADNLVYTHYDTGTVAGYRREIRFDVVGSEYVGVHVTVTWPGATRPVQVDTYLYNIYENGL